MLFFTEAALRLGSDARISDNYSDILTGVIEIEGRRFLSKTNLSEYVRRFTKALRPAFLRAVRVSSSKHRAGVDARRRDASMFRCSDSARTLEKQSDQKR